MGEWIATSAFRCDDLSELTESIRACLSRFDADFLLKLPQSAGDGT
jgi:hypothetical protein